MDASLALHVGRNYVFFFLFCYFSAKLLSLILIFVFGAAQAPLQERICELSIYLCQCLSNAGKKNGHSRFGATSNLSA